MGNPYERIIGYENEISYCKKITKSLLEKDRYKALGMQKFERGLYIYGRKGVGKSLLADCMAHELEGFGWSILRLKKEDGDFSAEIKDVFKKAREKNTAVIVMDDIHLYEKSRHELEYLPQIQSEMDALNDESSEVFIIATSNVGNETLGLDSLFRSGRFGAELRMELPYENSAAIVKKYLKDMPLDSDINWDDIVRLIPMGSVSCIEGALSRAIMSAGYAQQSIISKDCFIKSIISDGYSLSRDDLDEAETEEVIYHEVGHLVTLIALGELDNIGFISTEVKDGGADGYVRLVDEVKNRRRLIAVLLGGKACVEQFLNTYPIASGCKQDILRAAETITDGLTLSANRGFGFVQYEDSLSSGAASNAYAQNINAAASAEMERVYQLTRKILLTNKELVILLI